MTKFFVYHIKLALELRFLSFPPMERVQKEMEEAFRKGRRLQIELRNATHKILWVKEHLLNLQMILQQYGEPTPLDTLEDKIKREDDLATIQSSLHQIGPYIKKLEKKFEYHHRAVKKNKAKFDELDKEFMKTMEDVKPREIKKQKCEDLSFSSGDENLPTGENDENSK